jgi:hypothetical protein
MANPYANYFKPQNPNKQYLPFYGKSQEDIAKMQQQGYGGYGYKTPTEMWQAAGSPGGSNWNFDPMKGPVGPRQQPKMPMPRIPSQKMGGQQMPQMPQQQMPQMPQQQMPAFPQYGYKPASSPQTQFVPQYTLNPPKLPQTFGQQFAPVFADMMNRYEPKKPGANYYAEQEGKYKTYQPAFDKLGQFYSGLKNYYGDSISQKAGKEFNQVFFDYVSQLDPNALPQNIMNNFFDWLSNTISPYFFSGESDGVKAQIDAAAASKAAEEAAAKKLKEEQDAAAAKAKAEQEAAAAKAKAEQEAEAAKAYTIPADLQPYYDSIVALYKSNEFKPLKANKNADGSWTIENQFIISQQSYDYLKKLGAVP